jgi:hypothetical protein
MQSDVTCFLMGHKDFGANFVEMTGPQGLLALIKHDWTREYGAFRDNIIWDMIKSGPDHNPYPSKYQIGTSISAHRHLTALYCARGLQPKKFACFMVKLFV